MLPLDIEFLQPTYFPFLIIATLLCAISLILLIVRRIRRLQPSHNSRYPKIGEGIRWVLISIALIIVYIALSQPARTFPTWVRSGPLDIVVVIDQSLSMRARDIFPSRLEQAKQTALSIVQSGAMQEGDRISLFVFGKIGKIILPFTSDRGRFAADIMDLNYPSNSQATQIDAYFWGSDLSGSIQQLLQVLEDQHEFEKKFNLQTDDDKRKRIIFFITDGSDEEISYDTNAEMLLRQRAQEFRNSNAVVYPIAIGTQEGVPWISLLDGYIRNKHYTDQDVEGWEGLTARVNTSLLNIIARENGGEMFIIETSTDNPKNFIKESIDENRPELTINRNDEAKREWWWEMLLVAILIIAITLMFL